MDTLLVAAPFVIFGLVMIYSTFSPAAKRQEQFNKAHGIKSEPFGGDGKFR